MKIETGYFLCASCGQAIPTKDAYPVLILDLPLHAERQAIRRCVESGVMLCDDCSQVMAVMLLKKGQTPCVEIVFH